MDQDKYNRIKQQLFESTQWPSLYMFKFIVPNNEDKINAVKNLFPEDTEFSYKTSKDIRFIGVTVKKIMNSADDVVEVYSRAQGIKGIMSL
ncbi:DUF493 family protein [Marinifilum sp. N1E240]|uniref:DUF493 family protein n=1 Tax=Marinifilum sp. N1E240 TaxID=2608082 RepID=UPI00128C7C0B|nr:DUF493 family protein [Marinifilum sp. N1E240]MPQ46182.1 DUF493 family protein [Marinifilum sp. N1E240]